MGTTLRSWLPNASVPIVSDVDLGTLSTAHQKFFNQIATQVDGLNSGGVTSVNVSGGGTGLTTTGGPITTAGTISLAGVLNAEHGGTGLHRLGAAGQVLAVNAEGNAIEWVDQSGSLVSLSDVDITVETDGYVVTYDGTLQKYVLLAPVAPPGTKYTRGTTPPTTPAPVSGDRYEDTATSRLYTFNGATWVQF